MFFNKELKNLRSRKDQVVMRCELRRRLAPLEWQSIRARTRHSFSMLASLLAAGKIAFDMLQDARRSRKK